MKLKMASTALLYACIGYSSVEAARFARFASGARGARMASAFITRTHQGLVQPSSSSSTTAKHLYSPSAFLSSNAKGITDIADATNGLSRPGTPGILRRRRPNPITASLIQLARTDPRYSDGMLNMSTTDQTETTSTTAAASHEVSNIDHLFPNKGKNIMDLPPRMRFAPSPTGSLHVGGARTALYNWLVAKKGQLEQLELGSKNNSEGNEGGFILRVEDTDLARSTKESEESVLADLNWLGLHWDEGPTITTTTSTPSTEYGGKSGGKYGPYRQSERSSLYHLVAQHLLSKNLAYPCFCTPEELDAMKARQEAEGIPPRYDGTWRDADPSLVKQRMEEGVPYTVRFKVPPGARIVIEDAVRGTVSWDAEATVGDFILLRSNGIPVYNFCVAVDDATMGITTVIRAEEHLTNTLRQALVLDALGAPRPRYAHCSLILGEDKQKLSKRHGATSCNQFKLDGFLPDAMINYLALLGWNDGTDNEIFTREELIEAFDVDRIVKSPSVFDMGKLKWVNGQHLKRMEVEDILDLVRDQMDVVGMLDDNNDETDTKDFVFAATALAKQRMETLRDAVTNAQTVLGYDLPATFQDLLQLSESSPDSEASEARELVEQGNFYNVATKILQLYEEGNFPTPTSSDEKDLLAAFIDTSTNKAITEDTIIGGDEGSYPQAYKATMKAIAKELNLKGKHLFHPVRLALTGEMSGQDVTKQLSLLEMATSSNSVVNRDVVKVVPFEERMDRLKTFCESIPQQYREKKSAGDSEASSKSKMETGTSSASSTSSSGTSSTKSSFAAPSFADPLEGYDGPPITALDIRVGRINKVWVHPEADKLYCEEIDVGDEIPRQIASGLRPYMNAEDMEGRLVLVLCNLKERKLAGFPSHGMVLCASNGDHTQVKLVSPPVEAKVGERVTVPGFDFDAGSEGGQGAEGGEGGAPWAENKVAKKKVFEKLAPFLKTSEYGVPEFAGRPFLTSAGVCTSPIQNGSVA